MFMTQTPDGRMRLHGLGLATDTPADPATELQATLETVEDKVKMIFWILVAVAVLVLIFLALKK